jgi:hypothetical protein
MLSYPGHELILAYRMAYRGDESQFEAERTVGTKQSKRD